MDCSTENDALVLQVHAQSCPEGKCDEETEVEVNSTSPAVTARINQDDIFVRFNLTINIGGHEYELSDSELLGLNVTIYVDGELYRYHDSENPVHLDRGNWILVSSEWDVGRHLVKIVASHPTFINSEVLFVLNVLRAQVPNIFITDNEQNETSCFYRLEAGRRSDCGVSELLFKVESEDADHPEIKLEGNATCSFGDQGITYTFETPLEGWVQVSTSNLSVGQKNLKCEVLAPEYITTGKTKSFIVRGALTDAFVAFPETMTPGTEFTISASRVKDEFNHSVDPPFDYEWQIGDYPAIGNFTPFCYREVCSGLLLDVGPGNRTLRLMLRKKVAVPNTYPIQRIDGYDYLQVGKAVLVKEVSLYDLSLIPTVKAISTSGGKAKFLVSIQNSGNSEMKIRIGLEAEDKVLSWTNFSSEERTLLMRDTWSVPIQFNVPAQGEANYTFKVVSTNLDANISHAIEGKLIVTFQTVHGVSINLAENLADKIMLSGDEKKVEVQVSNDGNTRDTFDLEITGSGASIASLEQNSIELEAGDTGTVNLVIRGEPGIHEFKVCAQSRLKTSARSCYEVKVSVLEENAKIISPDAVQAELKQLYKLPVELLGYGQGTLILTADYPLSEWFNTSTLDISIPQNVTIYFTPTQKGNYTLNLELILVSGESTNKSIIIEVIPFGEAASISERMSMIQSKLKQVDEALVQLEASGVQAVKAQALMQSISQKRQKVQELLDEGDYKAAQAVMTELDGLIDELQKYTNIPLRVSAPAAGINFFQIGIGFMALLIGAVAIYMVFSTKNIKPKPPVYGTPMTSRMYPLR